MKFFATFLVASALAAGCLAAIDHEESQLKEGGSRIASGADAKKGENLDFCWFDAIFHNKWIRCSCFVYDGNKIVTAASCVKDPVEHAVQYMNITLPQAGGKPYEKQSIWTSKDYSNDMKFVKNYAIVKLTLDIDPKTMTGTPPKVKKAEFDLAATADKLKDTKVRICGNGRIYNNQTYPKNPQCTDMLVMDPAKCKVVTPAPPEGVECLTWEDRDNNACPGDYGSPVYIYTPPPATKPNDPVTNQKVIGIVIGSPDVRKGNAPCQDGHVLFYQPITVDLQTFFTNPSGADSGNPPIDV